ncbi:MAG: DUF3618 domain-containing protein [Nocardioidaceae bacterium]|nr:DUF3618 domain-containing protein [Nocardioidaceae bacterium]
MAQSPEEVRRDIELTREDLGRDVDALNDKVSPSRIAQRRLDATKQRAGSLKERVMGSASSGRSSMTGTAGSAGSAVTDTISAGPDMARRRTEGNPLAAGLVAFAAGWLVSSILPASKAEEQAAQALQDKAGDLAEPVKQQLSEVATEMKDNLQGPAQQAAQSVKDSATGAAATVKEEGTSAAQSVKEDAQGSAQQVKDAQSGGSSSSGSTF